MNSEEEENSDYFKTKLYENFQREGLLDNLKANLHIKMIKSSKMNIFSILLGPIKIQTLG